MGGTVWRTMASNLTWAQRRSVELLRKTLLSEGWREGKALDRELRAFEKRERARAPLADLLPRGRRRGSADRLRQAIAAAWMLGARKRARAAWDEIDAKMDLANSLTSRKNRKEFGRENRRVLKKFARELAWADHPEEKRLWDRARAMDQPVAMALIAASLTRDLPSARPNALLADHPELLPSVRSLHRSILRLVRDAPRRGASEHKNPRSILTVLAAALEDEYAHREPVQRTELANRLIAKYFPGQLSKQQIQAGMTARRRPAKKR